MTRAERKNDKWLKSKDLKRFYRLNSVDIMDIMGHKATKYIQTLLFTQTYIVQTDTRRVRIHGLHIERVVQDRTPQ